MKNGERANLAPKIMDSKCARSPIDKCVASAKKINSHVVDDGGYWRTNGYYHAKLLVSIYWRI